MAIYWLLSVLAQIPIVVMTFEQAGSRPLSMGTWVGIQFAISIVLWLFPATFSSMLLRAGKSPAPTGDVPLHEWHSLCFVAVGIFVLARAIPNAVYWLIVASEVDPMAADFTLEQKASVTAVVVEVAIGIAMVLGATGLSSLIQRLRRAGVPAHRPTGR